MLSLALQLYSYVILASIILSWIRLPENNPLVVVIGHLTEPVMAPLRRVVPPMGGFDLSPLIVLIGIRVLQGLLH